MYGEDGDHIPGGELQLALCGDGGAVEGVLNGLDRVDGESECGAVVFYAEAREVILVTAQQDREPYGIVGMDSVEDVVVVF